MKALVAAAEAAEAMTPAAAPSLPPEPDAELEEEDPAAPFGLAFGRGEMVREGATTLSRFVY